MRCKHKVCTAFSVILSEGFARAEESRNYTGYF